MSIKFESVYKRRLEALVAGYLYKNLPNVFVEKEEKLTKSLIPTVIVKIIERWYGGAIEPKLKMNLITITISPMQYEIYFDKPCNQILNVAKYILKYSTSSKKNKKKQKNTLFSKEVIIKNIHDNDYFIAMWMLNEYDHNEYWFKYGRQNDPFNIKLIAIDHNQTIVCTLTKSFTIFYATRNIKGLALRYYIKDASRLRKFNLFDQTNKKVNLEQFINSITRFRFEFELIDIKRFFYFVYTTYDFCLYQINHMCGSELIDLQMLCNCIIDLDRFDENHIVWKFTQILKIKLGFN